LLKKRTIGVTIISLLLIGLGIFDLFYGTVTSTFILMPLTFGYAAIGWILAIIAITTGVGLWYVKKWAYRMAIAFGVIEILLASADLYFAISGYWEQYLQQSFNISLSEIGYTHAQLVTETIITNSVFFVVSGLFIVAIVKMKPLLTLDPSETFLSYLKLYKRISISEMARRAGITEVDVELLSQELASKGVPLELNLQARELIYNA